MSTQYVTLENAHSPWAAVAQAGEFELLVFWQLENCHNHGARTCCFEGTSIGTRALAEWAAVFFA